MITTVVCGWLLQKGKSGHANLVESEKRNLEVVKTLLNILGKSEDLICICN